MIKQAFKRLWNDKRGNALVIAGAAMPMVIGSAGLATDTIQWVNWKRHLQRAADSAAIAGVYAKMQSQAPASAVATDLVTNNKTGVALLSTYPQLAFPADTTNYTNAVRVTLAIKQSLSFSSMFISTSPTITAAATAGIIQTGDYCVVSLESSATTGITATGSTDINLGCGMITNSTSLNAAVAAGSSSVAASPIAAVGGIQSSNNWATGTQLLPFTVAQSDPFGSIEATAPTTCVPGGNLTIGPSATLDLSAMTTAPCYNNLTVKGTLKLPPGPIYINGGDVGANSGALIDGTLGSTIVLTNIDTSPTATIGTMDLNGGATVKMVAPTSGNFKGIAIYQDRRAVDDGTTSASSPNKINGNSSSKYEGGIYFPKQQITFNGNAGINTNCMQLVVRRVYFSGNSAINNVCPVGSGASSFKGQHVRLVD